MTIWFDMTNSMYAWKGGVVGIVRAELEIAKNIKKSIDNVKYVKYDGCNFVEIQEGELEWLWNADSVGDEYLKIMKRNQTAGTIQEKNEITDLAKKHEGLLRAYEYTSSRLYRLLKGLYLYANTLPGILRPIAKGAITIFSWPVKKLAHFRVKLRDRNKIDNKVVVHNISKASYPFSEGDLFFSCGWIDTNKEEILQEIKKTVNNFSIVYLIYDIILLKKETKHFYPNWADAYFRKYLEWASFHCDAILYGGKTAMRDTQEYQRENGLLVPPGYPVYFGSEVTRRIGDEKEYSYQNEKIGSDYIMVVGSIDNRKNYSTLYRAFTILADQGACDGLKLVIVGKGDSCQDLVDTIKIDERTKDRIIFLSPTDDELHYLYKNAKFILLSSSWEGWSLTLPEALNYGKLVITSDVDPLREIGENMVVYADTYDPFDWAKKIRFFTENPSEVAKYEEIVRRKYKAISWEECGVQVGRYLLNQSKKKNEEKQTLYFDLSTSVLNGICGGKITGIIRAELMLLKKIYFKYDKIKVFSMIYGRGYIQIDIDMILPLISGRNLDENFNIFISKFSEKHLLKNESFASNKTNKYENRKEAFWHIVSVFPEKIQKKLIDKSMKHREKIKNKSVTDNEDDFIDSLPFKEDDIVFSAGTGPAITDMNRWLEIKDRKKIKYCSVIYDFTPILLPQVHRKETVEYYVPFLAFASKISDLIFYGGNTAKLDGLEYQSKNNLPKPESVAIKFGSDISNNKKEIDVDEDKDILKRLGIKGKYILAVGTMEVRKNHETLYRAYIRMLKDHEKTPQLVFAGHHGWKTKDFLEMLNNDQRVKGKILCLSPSDVELDVLYRNCIFTTLASLYEGWSLTLPESMYYNKFCLCCDTPALRETAGELSDYIHHWDEKMWAEKIYYYYLNPDAVKGYEEMIKKQWKQITWDDCANDIMRHINKVLLKY
ncbi:MAG: glycosyltransferase [Filifactoraceae bacterium]